jgi:hypothetical protein
MSILDAPANRFPAPNAPPIPLSPPMPPPVPSLRIRLSFGGYYWTDLTLYILFFLSV